MLRSSSVSKNFKKNTLFPRKNKLRVAMEEIKGSKTGKVNEMPIKLNSKERKKEKKRYPLAELEMH